MIKIYKLIDPITKLVKYIGKTKGDVLDRLAEHIGECSSRSTSGTKYTEDKYNWIRSLLKQGLCPLIEVIETLEDSIEANLKEFKHICLSNMAGYELYNLSGRLTNKIVEEMEYKTNCTLSCEYGVDGKTLSLARLVFYGKRTGGKHRKQTGRPKISKSKILTEDFLNENYILKDKSCELIGKEVGVSPRTVLIALRKFNIPVKTRRNCE